MYFAILGKNPEISKAELELIQPTNISYPKKGIICFETTQPEKLSTLGGIIKAGIVVKERELPQILDGIALIGIKETANGKHLKNTIHIKRFKLVDLFHTDKEVKEKGKELINLGNGDYGIVEQYQDIGLYETIDFEKPGRSMHMGMMPAKLTHIMINIGLTHLTAPLIKGEGAKRERDLVIYDPFVGSGTTGFLANYLGYDFIGSDIDISHIEKNSKRREKTPFAKAEYKFQIFQHDINKPINSPLIKGAGGIGNEANLLIISEGRLGPIVTSRTSPEIVQRNQKEVLEIYKSFLQRTSELITRHPSLVTVITIPYYQTNNFLEEELSAYAKKLGLSISSIPEVYQRENQKIGRKILIIQ